MATELTMTNIAINGPSSSIYHGGAVLNQTRLAAYNHYNISTFARVGTHLCIGMSDADNV